MSKSKIKRVDHSLSGISKFNPSGTDHKSLHGLPNLRPEASQGQQQSQDSDNSIDSSDDNSQSKK